MLRHARSAAASGAQVTLAGYVDSPIAPMDGIRVHPVPSFEHIRARGLFFFPLALARQVALAFAWWRTLRAIDAELVLVQDPPAFPLLILLQHKRFVIDWHNTTAAMLRLRDGDSRFVALIGNIEFRLARRAAAHLAVSHALKDHLATRGIDAAVLHDAPLRYVASRAPRSEERVVVMVPSSWSADDDFALLEELVRIWRGPHLHLVLTGRGPRRDAQLARFEAQAKTRVSFEARWFEPGAFHEALASADVGISVHRSAEGMDIPMKMFEMLGCGLPVCALDAGPAMHERFRDGRGVHFFHDAPALAALLTGLLAGWPDAKALDALAASAHDAVPQVWDDEWRERALPLLRPAPEE